jgi:hypothetical protein
MRFRRKYFVSGHFEHVIEPTNANAPGQFYCFFKSEQFSAVLTISKGFSNDQLAF